MEKKSCTECQPHWSIDHSKQKNIEKLFTFQDICSG
jgi:hypothetical protein